MSDLLPREFYRYGLQHFFGDHVDWSSLESFRISDTKMKRETQKNKNKNKNKRKSRRKL